MIKSKKSSLLRHGKRSKEHSSQVPLLQSSHPSEMSCNDCVQVTWTKCCCCCSGTQHGNNLSSNSTPKDPQNSQVHIEVIENEPKSMNAETASGESSNGIHYEADVSDLDDAEKYRYSGRNFDTIDLGDDPSDVKLSDKETTPTAIPSVSRLQVEGNNRNIKLSGKFRFTSTKRGAKNESVYSKTSQF
ncbi:uncharacterized protein LOC120339764 isoform X1 [Styela clava]